jgi:hypothetical protein
MRSLNFSKFFSKKYGTSLAMFRAEMPLNSDVLASDSDLSSFYLMKYFLSSFE